MPALDPTPVLALPVLFPSAPRPMAVLKLPVVLAQSAESPTAVLLTPLVLLKSA
jgi:hypothetical protein